MGARRSWFNFSPQVMPSNAAFLGPLCNRTQDEIRKAFRIASLVWLSQRRHYVWVHVVDAPNQ